MISLFSRREGPSSFTTDDGVRLVYETAGRGRSIVLVHGFASHRALNWKSTNWFETLTGAGFAVTAADGRGHGESGKPTSPGAYHLARMAADVAALIREAKLETPDLMGYSMGSRVALTLIMAEPGLVRRCILGGVGLGLVRGDAGQAAKIAAALEAATIEGISDPIALRFRQFADRYKGDRRALAQCIREMWTPFAPEALARVSTPVFVAAGGKDDQVSDPAGLASLIPGAQSLVVPGRDHMTVIADKHFKAAALDFLRA